MPRKMLVQERGLTDCRRNRRWLAIYRLLDEELGTPADQAEKLAWLILKTYEGTR